MKQRTLAMMTGFRRRGCFGRTQYRAAEWTALVSHAVLRGAILSVHGRAWPRKRRPTRHPASTRNNLTLTAAVLGIDLSRSAVPSYLSRSGSTEPGLTDS